MIKSQADSQPKLDEFAKILNEYRARIDEIVVKTTEKSSHLLAEDTLNPAQNDGYQDNVHIEESAIDYEDSNLEQKRREAERQAYKEASEIISDAKSKAQQLIREAEEKTKKDARKKTKSEVEKIIDKARKEAETIISKARQTVEKEKTGIINQSRQEAERLIKEVTEKYREETQAQSNQLIDAAREKAGKMIEDVLAASNEISQHVMNITEKTTTMMTEFENELHTQYSVLASAIAEAGKKLELYTEITVEKPTKKTRDSGHPDTNEEPAKDAVLNVRVNGQKSGRGNDGSYLFIGKMEIKTASSSDYTQIIRLRDYLKKVPGMKHLAEYASEKEMSVSFEAIEPVKLPDIFSDTSLLDNIVPQDDGFDLVIKNTENKPS